MPARPDREYANVFRLKRRVITQLVKLIAPYLYPSGYVDKTEPDGWLRVYVIRDNRGEWKPLKIPKAVGDPVIGGFTRCGVISNAYAGGMVDTPFKTMPIEDLIRLENVMRRRKAEGRDRPHKPGQDTRDKHPAKWARKETP